MKTFQTAAASLTAAIFLPSGVFAHAGHGHDNPLSPGHFINNPEHALPTLAALSALLVGTWLLYRRSQKVKNK